MGRFSGLRVLVMAGVAVLLLGAAGCGPGPVVWRVEDGGAPMSSIQTEVRKVRRGFSVGGLTGALTLSAVSLVPLGLWVGGITPPGFPRGMMPPPSLAIIEKKGDLATARIHIRDYIEGSNADYKGRWLLFGEILLGVDLQAVRYLRTDPAKREAVLHLPAPHIIATKINHEASEELYLHWASWRPPVSSKQVFRDEVWKMADRKLQKLGQEPGYAERAKVQAERVLLELFAGAGWKVRFEWDEQPPEVVAASVKE